MSLDEKVIRSLEDFILTEHQLDSVGNLRFEHQGKEELGYPYLRASNRSLVSAIVAIKAIMKPAGDELRFLEVGCGLGTKTELARLSGMQAFGIDLLPEYVELAQKIYPDCKFDHANALHFQYESYDIVYYHVPFFDDHLIRQLEERVLSQVRRGAMMIATRLSTELAQLIDEQSTSGYGCAVKRVSVDEDVGRLTIVQKG